MADPSPDTAAAKAATISAGKRFQAHLRYNPDTTDYAEHLIEEGPGGVPLNPSHLLTHLQVDKHSTPSEAQLDHVVGVLRGYDASKISTTAGPSRITARNLIAVIADFAMGYNALMANIVAEKMAKPPAGGSATGSGPAPQGTAEDRARQKSMDANSLANAQGLGYTSLEPQHKLKDKACSLISPWEKVPPQVGAWSEHFPTAGGYYNDVDPAFITAGSSLAALMYNLFRNTCGHMPDYVTPTAPYDDLAPTIEINGLKKKVMFDVTVLHQVIGKASELDKINNRAFAIEIAKEAWSQTQTMLARNTTMSLTALFGARWNAQAAIPALEKASKAIYEQYHNNSNNNTGSTPSRPAAGGDKRKRRDNNNNNATPRTASGTKPLGWYPRGQCKTYCKTGKCPDHEKTPPTCKYGHDPEHAGKYPNAGERN